MKKRGNAVLIAAIVFFVAVAVVAITAWGTIGFTDGNITHWFNGWGKGISPVTVPSVTAPITSIGSFAAFSDFEDTQSIKLNYTYGDGNVYGKFIGYKLEIKIDEEFINEFQAQLSFDVEFTGYSAIDTAVELETGEVENTDGWYFVSAPAHRLLLSDFIENYDGLSESCKVAIKKVWYEVYDNYSDLYNASYDVEFYYCDTDGKEITHIEEAGKACNITGRVYWSEFLY